MHKVSLNMSVLMAGVVFSTAVLAIDAPAAPAVAAPAATVGTTAIAPVAPVAADTSATPAQAPTDVAVAPKVDEKPTVLAEADALALLKKSNCLICHSIQKKVIGPAYMDVAAKYRGQADAEAKLFAKVTTGGKGVWGSMPMPPQKANPEDIKSLIRFVLSLSPINVAKTN